MDLELVPGQPDDVVRTVRALIEDAVGGADPWWQTGIEEALSTAEYEPGAPPDQG
jgi:hypothetical protein